MYSNAAARDCSEAHRSAPTLPCFSVGHAPLVSAATGPLPDTPRHPTVAAGPLSATPPDCHAAPPHASPPCGTARSPSPPCCVAYKGCPTTTVTPFSFPSRPPSRARARAIHRPRLSFLGLVSVPTNWTVAATPSLRRRVRVA
jgi:hypothetical protein